MIVEYYNYLVIQALIVMRITEIFIQKDIKHLHQIHLPQLIKINELSLIIWYKRMDRAWNSIFA